MDQIILTEKLFSTSIHAITKREYAEGYLEPGTLIRRLSTEWDNLGYMVWDFQASTDGGKAWFWERSHEQPQTK